MSEYHEKGVEEAFNEENSLVQIVALLALLILISKLKPLVDGKPLQQSVYKYVGINERGCYLKKENVQIVHRVAEVGLQVRLCLTSHLVSVVQPETCSDFLQRNKSIDEIFHCVPNYVHRNDSH